MRADWQGFYLDGRSAVRRPASIRLTRTGLDLEIEGAGTARWPYVEIRQTQGFYAGEQVRLERGGELPEILLVPDPEFLASLHEIGADIAGRFHDPARRALRRRLTLLAGVATVVLAVAIYRWGIPALAAVAAARVPVSWEEALGQQTVATLAPPERRCADPARIRVIERIVARLIVNRPSPYTFRIVMVDDPLVNAFALPGGYLLIVRGLLDQTRTPEELAGVLAHEIEHILQRHTTRSIVQHASTGLLFAALAGDATGALAYGIEGARVLGELRYSRAAEEEADAGGMAMLLDARIDPAGTIAFFERLEAGDRDEPRAVKYLSSHPTTRERIERLRALAAQRAGTPATLLSDQDWSDVKKICAGRPPRAPRP